MAEGVHEVFDLCEKYFGLNSFVSIVGMKMAESEVEKFREKKDYMEILTKKNQ